MVFTYSKQDRVLSEGKGRVGVGGFGLVRYAVLPIVVDTRARCLVVIRLCLFLGRLPRFCEKNFERVCRSASK